MARLIGLRPETPASWDSEPILSAAKRYFSASSPSGRAIYGIVPFYPTQEAFAEYEAVIDRYLIMLNQTAEEMKEDRSDYEATRRKINATIASIMHILKAA